MEWSTKLGRRRPQIAGSNLVASRSAVAADRKKCRRRAQ